MRLVSRLIVEEIDGYRDVVLRVKNFQVNFIGTLDKRPLLGCAVLAFRQSLHLGRSWSLRARPVTLCNYLVHTAFSISGTVRGTCLSATASRPNSSPATTFEKRMVTAR